MSFRPDSGGSLNSLDTCLSIQRDDLIIFFILRSRNTTVTALFRIDVVWVPINRRYRYSIRGLGFRKEPHFEATLD